MSKQNVVHFEGIGHCFYDRVGFRSPRKGEFYLSGAIVEAYLAPNDLTTAYNVVTPTRYAVRGTIWKIGKPVLDPTIYGGHVDHSQVETVKAGKL